MRSIIALTLILLIHPLLFAQNKSNRPMNALTKKDIKQGWALLFDGQTLSGWKGFNSDQVFGCWSVANGELVCTGEGGSVTAGDIVTVSEFGSFELSLDWCISKGGNSGIFYHVQEGPQYQAAYETGPEYQLIDDAGWPDKLEGWQQSGADYAMTPAIKDKKLMPAGEWNHTCIVYDKGHVEYWLNGIKVVEFKACSPEWKKLRNESKWKDYPGYAIAEKGHIGLQNHGSGVKFRNIKVRKLD
jgi:hypothetical protein